MPGHYPPQPPAPGGPGPAHPGYPPYGAPPRPAYGPPQQIPYQQYVLPQRRPPRRTAGGSIAGILGGMAALGVAVIVALSAFGAHDGGPAGIGGRSAPQSNRAAATDSKLYKTGALAEVECRLPKIRADDTASMRRFMDTLSGCLDAAWGGQFRKADLAFDAPKRVFWTDSGRSPCGSYPVPGAAAFYCPENQTMYVGLSHVIETAGNEPVSHYAVYARVIAHEYGHHVQDRAGILDYGHQLMDQPDVARRTEASRRIELQAQCFAGAFLGVERNTLPMTRLQFTAMIEDVQGRGDDRLPPEKHDHGSSRNYAGWVQKGYRGRVLAVCNTWTASSSAVS